MLHTGVDTDVHTDVDIVLIGHFAKDRNVYQGQAQIQSGGSVYFSSLALARLGWRVAVVTMLHHDDFPRLDELKNAGVRVFTRSAPVTSGIENTYTTPDMDRRTCKPLAFAGKFRPSDIPDLTAHTWIVGPIIAGEVDLKFLRALAGRGVLALDVQGFVRVPEGDSLVFKDWPEKQAGLAMVDALKVDAAEAESLTGLFDVRAAMRQLAAWGPREIVLTQASGVTVYAQGAFYEAPFTAQRILGRTGRGDTCFSSYLARRLSADPGEACAFAGAVTSIKMERPGPFAGSLADVQARMGEARQATL